MDLFESWMRECQVSFEDDIMLFSLTPLVTATATDFNFGRRDVKKGVRENFNCFTMIGMFKDTLSPEDRVKCGEISYPDVVKLARKLMRERKERLLTETLPQDETLFKKGFMGALFGCDTIISPYEAIGRIDDLALENELAHLHAEIEREYHEQLWTKMIDRIPKQTLITMISESRGIDLPENFPELMRLVPGVDPDYVHGLRSEDSKRLMRTAAD